MVERQDRALAVHRWRPTPERPWVGGTVHGDRRHSDHGSDSLRGDDGSRGPQPSAAALQLPPSLPTGFYRPSFPDALARGDLVRVCLPEAHAAPALERGYLNPGRCPGSTELLAKVLVALPGDTVHVGSTNTRESEGLVMRAPVVVLDSKSRPVPALLGPRVMGADECFVLST